MPQRLPPPVMLRQETICSRVCSFLPGILAALTQGMLTTLQLLLETPFHTGHPKHHAPYLLLVTPQRLSYRSSTVLAQQLDTRNMPSDTSS